MSCLDDFKAASPALSKAECYLRQIPARKGQQLYEIRQAQDTRHYQRMAVAPGAMAMSGLSVATVRKGPIKNINYASLALTLSLSF